MNIEKMYVNKIGKGYPIIMLHGFPLDHNSLMPFESYFDEDNKWQRYYIDLPGMGQSRGAGVIQSASDVLQFLIQYIEEEFNDRKFAIVGYSFGALLATALAEQFSDQIESLFLLAPETEAETAKRTLPKRAVYHMSNLDSRIDQDELLAYRATVVLESQDKFNLFKKYILPGLNSNEDNEIVRYLSENPKLAKEPPEYLKSYKGSVTIVTGQNDNMVGFQDAFSLYCTLQEAEFVCISKSGHTLHLDRPAIIKEIFTDWLRNLNARVTP